MLLLEEAGFDVRFESDAPTDAAVVNTCGFIGDAKEESVNTILDLVSAKENGSIKHLYVMGCLAERYRMDLEKRYRRSTDFSANSTGRESLTSSDADTLRPPPPLPPQAPAGGASPPLRQTPISRLPKDATGSALSAPFR